MELYACVIISVRAENELRCCNQLPTQHFETEQAVIKIILALLVLGPQVLSTFRSVGMSGF
jgi:hypothetical protein